MLNRSYPGHTFSRVAQVHSNSAPVHIVDIGGDGGGFCPHLFSLLAWAGGHVHESRHKKLCLPVSRSALLGAVPGARDSFTSWLLWRGTCPPSLHTLGALGRAAWPHQSHPIRHAPVPAASLSCCLFACLNSTFFLPHGFVLHMQVFTP